MPDHDEIDEVALNVLWAEGVDFPTAYVASMKSNGKGPPPPRRRRRPRAVRLAVWFILAIALLWLFLRS